MAQNGNGKTNIVAVFSVKGGGDRTQPPHADSWGPVGPVGHLIWMGQLEREKEKRSLRKFLLQGPVVCQGNKGRPLSSLVRGRVFSFGGLSLSLSLLSSNGKENCVRTICVPAKKLEKKKQKY